jgi:hypothetical protein
MEKRKLAGLYAVTVGTLMILMWLGFIATGQVVEFQTEPIKIAFHLLAEFLTASLLIAGGFGLYTGRNWGTQIFMVSMGMLLYTVVMSPGYFIQGGTPDFAGFFGVLTVMTLFFIYDIMKDNGDTR